MNEKRMRKYLALLRVGAALYIGWGQLGETDVVSSRPDTNAGVATAFSNRQSGVQVSGESVVDRILSDDTEGGRHQRFTLRLASGQTLLVAHNIAIPPRIPSLEPGDTVSFNGVYEWNGKGGVLHWTHHDPNGKHEAGCSSATARRIDSGEARPQWHGR